MKAILYGVPIFLVVILVEHIFGRRRGRPYYEGRDTVANLTIGAGSQVFGMFYLVLFIGVYGWVFDHVAPVRFEVTILSGLGCFVALDIMYYWAHRFSHEWNFLWGGHIVHHSSEQMNVAVGFRQPWFHHIPGFVFFLPVALLGFSPLLFWPIVGFMRLYPLCLHTEAVDRMPTWYEALFNTPSHHRVHHGRSAKYRGKNYGAILIVWDKLFGTFQVEEEQPVYGISRPLGSANPLWANVHYYAEMYDVARGCPKFLQKLYVLVARPGWRPTGWRAPAPRAGSRARRSRGRVSPYVALQVALAVTGTLAFMYFFEALSPLARFWFGGVLIMTLVSIAGLMEGKRWAVGAEGIRWALIFAGGLVCLPV